MLIALIALIAGVMDKTIFALALFLFATASGLVAESNVLGTIGADRPVNLYGSQVAMVMAQNAITVFLSFALGLGLRAAWRLVSRRR